MTKMSDYFNSTTLRGRANVAKATYASIAVLYIFNRFKKSNNKAEPRYSNENHVHKTETPSPEPKSHYECPHCACKETNNAGDLANNADNHDLTSKSIKGHTEASPKSHNNHDNKSDNSNCEKQSTHNGN